MKIGALWALTLIFVIAKLVGFINWSWWVVFSPAIASVVIDTILVFIMMALAWYSAD